MAKSVKFYTFHFFRSTKSNIRIRRIRLSKKVVQSGTIGLFLVVGIFTLGFGLSGVVRIDAVARTTDATSMQQMLVTTRSAAPSSALDYSRPAASAQLALNSGGPAADDDSETSSIEDRVKAIQAISNPASLPSIWAHLGKINNEFGFRRNPFGGRTYEFHAGMDIDGDRGDAVSATANGTVLKAGWQGGYGNMVEIDHGNGLTTRYGHLSRVDVQVGESVIRGQLIGAVGSTGRSTGPHLHYEVRINERAVNPRFFLPPEPANLARLN